MFQTTDVHSNSIQNKRVTESGKPLDIDKAFSFYIHGLKEHFPEAKPAAKVDKDEDQKNVVFTQERLETLGDISFKEHNNFYTLTQKWLGTIIEISDTGFTAKLEDLNEGGTFEIAEFFNAEISKDDKPLMSIGAIFYWSLGYANTKGSIEKKSVIRFQRLPEWTANEFDAAFDKANSQIKNAKWL